ncbi:hypothetical protein NL676_018627 [Syzygium grande]|nr:hypothetical protein NL676_018627 [Syzygium grande]
MPSPPRASGGEPIVSLTRRASPGEGPEPHRGARAPRPGLARPIQQRGEPRMKATPLAARQIQRRARLAGRGSPPLDPKRASLAGIGI